MPTLTVNRAPCAALSSICYLCCQTTNAASLSLSLSPWCAVLSGSARERSAEASLAIAEMKLAEQGKYAPRLESVEGGADYVSASIVDSLLLEKLLDGKKTK